LPKIEPASTGLFVRRFCLALLLSFLVTPIAAAQTVPENTPYARVNTFGFIAAYANDSSHMLLGTAERRKLLDFGASYSRRLFMNRLVNWQYSVELLPVALESDPLSRTIIRQVTPTVETTILNDGPLDTCAPQAFKYSYMGPKNVIYSGTETYFCYGRQWTIGEAFSPIGFQWNFRPRHKLQPFLVGHGGEMYSTRPIPVAEAGSFNFTFDIGGGLELYRTKSSSVRAEYRFHHISNSYTAAENPGIDSGLFQITYAFGR